MKRFGFLYFLIALLVLYIPTTGEGEVWKTYITKPFIMISLFYYSWQTLKNQIGVTEKLLLFAISAGFLGDMFLMFEGTIFFILGMVSFLTAHALYSTIFYRMGSNIGWEGGAWGINVTVLVYFMILIYIAAPYLGTMLSPILIYCVGLSLLVLFAYGTLGNVPFESSMQIFLGAIFFVISDSVLAWNMFVDPITNEHFIIMGTYVAAQYFLVMGITGALIPEHSSS